MWEWKWCCYGGAHADPEAAGIGVAVGRGYAIAALANRKWPPGYSAPALFALPCVYIPKLKRNMFPKNNIERQNRFN